MLGHRNLRRFEFDIPACKVSCKQDSIVFIHLAVCCDIGVCLVDLNFPSGKISCKSDSVFFINCIVVVNIAGHGRGEDRQSNQYSHNQY